MRVLIEEDGRKLEIEDDDLFAILGMLKVLMWREVGTFSKPKENKNERGGSSTSAE